jgi:polyhydroxyalkanoate synthesis regulator phasin
MERGEEGRISATNNMSALTERISTLTDQMKTEQSLMMKLAETQLEIKPLLAGLAQNSGQRTGAMDEAAGHNIRNIDIQMARLIEELATGRNEVVSELRSEIRVLSRTMAAIAERANK